MYLANEFDDMSKLLDNIKYLFQQFLRRGSKTEPGVSEGEFIDSARMTHNRLQSLEGHGHRQCYMEKLREVAAETAPVEEQKDYWFKPTDSATNLEAVNNQAPTTTGKDKDKGLNGCLPNRAKITSYRLKAYVDSLPKDESSIDEP